MFVLSGEILAVVDRADLLVVALDHQAEGQAGLAEAILQRVGDRLLRRLVGDGGADAVVRGHQHQLGAGGRPVERLAGRAVQKSRTSRCRQRRQSSALRPVAQRGRVAGERQAALKEQADQLFGGADLSADLSRAGMSCGGDQQSGGDQQRGADQRRSSIWIGPSRRPWVN